MTDDAPSAVDQKALCDLATYVIEINGRGHPELAPERLLALAHGALAIARELDAARTEIQRRSSTSSDVTIEGLRLLLAEARAEADRLARERDAWVMQAHATLDDVVPAETSLLARIARLVPVVTVARRCRFNESSDLLVALWDAVDALDRNGHLRG